MSLFSLVLWSTASSISGRRRPRRWWWSKRSEMLHSRHWERKKDVHSKRVASSLFLNVVSSRDILLRNGRIPVWTECSELSKEKESGSTTHHIRAAIAPRISPNIRTFSWWYHSRMPLLRNRPQHRENSKSSPTFPNTSPPSSAH